MTAIEGAVVASDANGTALRLNDPVRVLVGPHAGAVYSVSHIGGFDVHPGDVSLASGAGLVGLFSARDLMKVPPAGHDGPA